MVPNVSVRTYRPRQMATMREEQVEKSRNPLHLSGALRRFAVAACLVALVAGLVITQLFYGQMMEMRAKAEQLQGANNRIYTQNVSLLAQRAQLSSKDRMVAVAGAKLQLFEPDQRQVRRM